MTEAGKKYLSDILRAIELIDDFTQEIKGFSAYQSNLKTQSAVERQLSIIGEALNPLQKVENQINIKHDKPSLVFETNWSMLMIVLITALF